jgi:hypothetical protein
MESKDWWMSKTIWTGLVTSLVAIATGVGVKLDWLTPEMQGSIVTSLMAVAGVVVVILRKNSNTAIK